MSDPIRSFLGSEYGLLAGSLRRPKSGAWRKEFRSPNDLQQDLAGFDPRPRFSSEKEALPYLTEQFRAQRAARNGADGCRLPGLFSEGWRFPNLTIRWRARIYPSLKAPAGR
jgi:hypothetical protein